MGEGSVAPLNKQTSLKMNAILTLSKSISELCPFPRCGCIVLFVVLVLLGCHASVRVGVISHPNEQIVQMSKNASFNVIFLQRRRKCSS